MLLGTAQREHDVGFLSLGPQLLHFQQIPPGEQSYYFSARCSLDIDTDLAPEGLTVTDYFPHMHYRGRRLWTEILGEAASGESAPMSSKFAEVGESPFGTLGSIDNFDSELNLGYQLKTDERNRKLQRGDLLATTCIFNTEGVTGPTRGGFGTYDEMCINFVVRSKMELCYCAWLSLFGFVLIASLFSLIRHIEAHDLI